MLSMTRCIPPSSKNCSIPIGRCLRRLGKRDRALPDRASDGAQPMSSYPQQLRLRQAHAAARLRVHVLVAESSTWPSRLKHWTAPLKVPVCARPHWGGHSHGHSRPVTRHRAASTKPMSLVASGPEWVAIIAVVPSRVDAE
jgi:hypothetical protein